MHILAMRADLIWANLAIPSLRIEDICYKIYFLILPTMGQKLVIRLLSLTAIAPSTAV
jgi:hypothetical protein